MEIKRCGSQPSSKGSPEYFTGSVRIHPLINPPDPSRVAMTLVTGYNKKPFHSEGFFKLENKFILKSWLKNSLNKNVSQNYGIEKGIN